MIESEAPKARLLAVDDNSNSAELIVRVASKCGYEARPMTDLRPLRSVLEEWKPDVLTLDLVMPQEDGIAILSVLKESQFSGTLIIISGQDDWLRETAGRLASASGLNVAHHLVKADRSEGITRRAERSYGGCRRSGTASKKRPGVGRPSASPYLQQPTISPRRPDTFSTRCARLFRSAFRAALQAGFDLAQQARQIDRLGIEFRTADRLARLSIARERVCRQRDDGDLCRLED